jgi:hypothetical protein
MMLHFVLIILKPLTYTSIYKNNNDEVLLILPKQLFEYFRGREHQRGALACRRNV